MSTALRAVQRRIVELGLDKRSRDRRAGDRARAGDDDVPQRRANSPSASTPAPVALYGRTTRCSRRASISLHHGERFAARVARRALPRAVAVGRPASRRPGDDSHADGRRRRRGRRDRARASSSKRSPRRLAGADASRRSAVDARPRRLPHRTGRARRHPRRRPHHQHSLMSDQRPLHPDHARRSRRHRHRSRARRRRAADSPLVDVRVRGLRQAAQVRLHAQRQPDALAARRRARRARRRRRRRGDEHRNVGRHARAAARSSRGDTIVAAHDCYGGTQRLLRALAGAALRRSCSRTSPRRDARPEVARHDAAPRLGRDAEQSAAAHHRHSAPSPRRRTPSARCVVVDNTFLSPALQQPIALGADIVVHSTTKYLNGHSDVVGGAVIARDEALGDELGVVGELSRRHRRAVRQLSHAARRAHAARPHARSISRTRAAVVDALRRSRRGDSGLLSRARGRIPATRIAASQQSGFGAMVSFEVRGGRAGVETFTSSLEYFTLAESLGGVESLIAHPATMTHASMDAEARAHRRASAIRWCGCRSASRAPDDLVRDLTRALDAVAARVSVGEVARESRRR